MTVDWTIPEDDLGPEKVVVVLDRPAGLKGFVVVDNVAAGPAIGGIRMAPDVTVQEVGRLARAMTLKNAAAGLPHGGGKAGIVADPHSDARSKETLIRAFGRAIRQLEEYIPGPDMGTDERCMAWLHDEMGRSVGLPRVLGGIPLDSIGATGFGLAICAEVASRHLAMPLRGARVAVQGFGAVGQHAARFLAERGALITGVADSQGTIVREAGLPVEELITLKRRGGNVGDLANATRRPAGDVIALDCEILIPAARPDVITGLNAAEVKARLVLQGANVPVTTEAEQAFHERGIVSIPDFIANAGGVICAAVEYHGGTEAQALAAITERVRGNTEVVLKRASETRQAPRQAALTIAEERVREAMAYRRKWTR